MNYSIPLWQGEPTAIGVVPAMLIRQCDARRLVRLTDDFSRIKTNKRLTQPPFKSADQLMFAGDRVIVQPSVSPP